MVPAWNTIYPMTPAWNTQHLNDTRLKYTTSQWHPPEIHNISMIPAWNTQHLNDTRLKYTKPHGTSLKYTIPNDTSLKHTTPPEIHNTPWHQPEIHYTQWHPPETRNTSMTPALNTLYPMMPAWNTVAPHFSDIYIDTRLKHTTPRDTSLKYTIHEARLKYRGSTLQRYWWHWLVWNTQHPNEVSFSYWRPAETHRTSTSEIQSTSTS